MSTATPLAPPVAPSWHVVPFNRPFMTGRELEYIGRAVANGQISGNGAFTKSCHEFFHRRYGFGRCLLTTSCTDALEMAAILLDIGPGDEVILPAFTFVSTANAFALRGAVLKFADSSPDNPNIDPNHVERLVSARTKAIVLVHYAGIACDMDRFLEISLKHGIPLVEDAAHAIDSFHGNRPLGSFGALSTFSFHETKNIICGEGGLLVVNDARFWERAEIIWEKGTNRAAFARGEVQKYRWVDLGSSFLPSDLTAAFLLSQLESIGPIQAQRIQLWRKYHERLAPLADKGFFALPSVPPYATVNGHLFALLTRTPEERIGLIDYLSERGIQALFHYLPLNESPYFSSKHTPSELLNCRRYAECLLRLPLFYTLAAEQLDLVCDSIGSFYSR